MADPKSPDVLTCYLLLDISADTQKNGTISLLKSYSAAADEVPKS